MNKEKAETSLENYQALSELYSNMRKELERTRRALDVAKEALKYARQRGLDNTATLFAVGSKADKALEQIRALEQRGVK